MRKPYKHIYPYSEDLMVQPRIARIMVCASVQIRVIRAIRGCLNYKHFYKLC